MASKEEGEEEKKNETFMEKVKDSFHDLGERIESALGFGKPTAAVSDFHLPYIDLERADILLHLLISNPCPIPIPLIEIQYLIQSDGRDLISGTIPDAGTIHSHGSETIEVPLTLIYQDIKDTYEDIKPGQVIPYRVQVKLVVDVPVLGKITLPLEKTGKIPVPYKPEVDVDKVEWDHLSMEETAATMHLKVDNKNKFKLGVKTLVYDLSLAEVPIAKASLSKSAEIESEGLGYLQVPVAFRPKDFGVALWDIIRGKGAGYSMQGKLEVDTPFGPMHLPFNREGGRTQFKKKSGHGDPVEDAD